MKFAENHYDDLENKLFQIKATINSVVSDENRILLNKNFSEIFSLLKSSKNLDLTDYDLIETLEQITFFG